MKTFTLVVCGTPRPGGSKTPFFNRRTGKLGVKPDNKHTAKWMSEVRKAAAEQYDGPLLLGPVYMQYNFRMPRPKIHFRSGKFSHVLKDDAPYWHTNTPDLTKIIRSTEDALTGIVYKDDSQVCTRDEVKRYCEVDERPGVIITLYEIQ